MRPMISPSALRSTTSQPTEVGQERLVRKGSRAWDLTPSARPAFRFFTLTPFPKEGQEPTPTFQSSSGCAAFRTAHIHTPACNHWQVAVFQGFVACLPSRPTLRRSFTLGQHRSLQTGGCSRLRTSNLYHHSQRLGILIESLPLAPSAQSHWLRSAVRLASLHATLGGWHTIQPGFWPHYPPHSWRAATLDFAPSPVLDSPSGYRGRC